MDIERLKAAGDVQGLIAALVDVGCQVAAARALGELGDRRAIIPLTRLLLGPNLDLTPVLSSALDAIGPAAIRHELTPLLNDRRADPILRENAAMVLAMHPAESLAEPLIAAAGNPANPDGLRNLLMIALGAVALRASVPVKTRIIQALTDLRTDGNKAIRASAAETLESIRLATQGPTPSTP